jgi:hypothetical protein
MAQLGCDVEGEEKGEAEMEMELHMGPAVGAKILR